MPVPPRGPAGFTRLQRRGPDPATQVGCIFLLAVPLTLLGAGLLAVFFINPAGKGSMWVMPVVAGAFAFFGLVLLYAGLRGLRGAGIPPTEVFIEGGSLLTAGTSTRLRVRQPGPVKIEALTVKLVCNRMYPRQVSRGSGTVEDQELLFEQVPVVIKDERLAAGQSLEREAVLTLPADVPPTGPALPDGTIRWTVEVWGEVGFLRAIYHPFALEVTRPAVSSATPGGARAPNP